MSAIMRSTIQTFAPPISRIARSRHTAKAYTPMELSKDEVAVLLDLLWLSPSSVNSQPWHFIVATDPGSRDHLARIAADETYSFNSDNIRQAGMAVVFASRQSMDEGYLTKLLDQEALDGRFPTETNRAEMAEIRKWFVDLMRGEDGSAADWAARQTYWNGGQFLFAAAAMGLDATPMEGVDTDAIDREFGLKQAGYGSLFMVTVGRNDDEKDWNADLPKSRLPLESIVTRL